AGDVVGQPDDARRLDAGRRLQLVERDDRAGPRIDDLAAHAEIAEHALERGRVLLQRLHAGRETLLRLGGGEQSQRRRLVAARRLARSGLRGGARRLARRRHAQRAARLVLVFVLFAFVRGGLGL